MTFQASGSLWRDALVLQDPETQTLWSQVTGEAMVGSHSGSKLEVYPSSMTTFGEFLTEYPDGRILAKPEGLTESHYKRYYADRGRLGIFGTQNSDTRLGGKDKILGLRSGYVSVAVAAPESGEPVLQVVTLGDQAVWVFWDPATSSAASWKAPTGDSVRLTRSDETWRLATADGNSSWDAVSGRPAGKTGASLEAAPFLIAYWFAWKNFYPATELVLPQSE